MTDTQNKTNRIRVANPDVSGNPITYLTSDINAGVTSLPILSKEGFYKLQNGDTTYFWVLIGVYGQEKAEIVKITAETSGNISTLTCAATKYSHSQSDPITVIQFDQIKYYGLLTSTGDKTELVVLDIDCSKQYTEYIVIGNTYSYLCTAYYDSANTNISEYSEIITSTSFTRLSAKRIIESGLRKALTRIDESEDSDLTWDIALEVLQDGIDEIFARKRKWSFLHKIDTSVSTVANTAYVSLLSDCLILSKLMVNNKPVTLISKSEYDILTQGDTVKIGEPINYTLRNNLIYFYPTPDAVYTVQQEYYSKIAEIVNLSTAIPYAFITILIYYCASQFAYIKGNDKRGDKMYAMFTKLLEQQCEEYSGPESDDAEKIEFTNELFMEDISSTNF